MPVNSNLAYILFLSSPMPSLQMLISTGHWKVQTNAVKASRIWVKQRQYIFRHYQLDHVSPSHTPVMGVCMCHVSSCLHPSFAFNMGRRAVGLIVVLLLLLSGDIETNPGPVGEVLCLTF